MRSLNGGATVGDLALGLLQTSLQWPASFPWKPPIQLAAAVPLHGIYSIDDWEAAIPKKKLQRSNTLLDICSPLIVQCHPGSLRDKHRS